MKTSSSSRRAAGTERHVPHLRHCGANRGWAATCQHRTCDTSGEARPRPVAPYPAPERSARLCHAKTAPLPAGDGRPFPGIPGTLGLARGESGNRSLACLPFDDPRRRLKFRGKSTHRQEAVRGADLDPEGFPAIGEDIVFSHAS